ncbi:MAG: nuclear transport factor 2 family protein [Variovorax sp.]|nr:nuclear transport factor 2 family protein [Variovorax sp.]
MPSASTSIDPLDYLLSVDAIRQVKARYCRYIDTKQWQRLGELFTPDCRFEGLGSAPPGADVAAFVAGVSSRLAPTISVHHVHQHEVVMTGRDIARVVWAMEDFVEFTDGSTVKETPGSRGFYGYGHYEEEYRRDDGEWRISFLRLTRLRLDAVPIDAPLPRMGQRQATSGWLDAAPREPAGG